MELARFPSARSCSLISERTLPDLPRSVPPPSLLSAIDMLSARQGHSSKDVEDDHCFSLVTSGQSLDLEATSKMEVCLKYSQRVLCLLMLSSERQWHRAFRCSWQPLLLRLRCEVILRTGDNGDNRRFGGKVPTSFN